MKAGEFPSHLLNRLYHGSIFDILPEIPDESIDCVFADPDYNVGVRYEGTSYTKKFNQYIDECIAWAKETRRVLRKSGNFYIINYGKNNSYLRARYLDDAFKHVFEYVWIYKTNIGQGPKHLTTAHRIILHCTKSDNNKFSKEAIAEPYQNLNDRRIKSLIAAGSPGRMPYSWIETKAEDRDWFEYNLVKNVGTTKTFHSCQIPESLSSMLFRASCKKGDRVLVLFGGAGSELVVAKRLGLDWISAEMVPEYCNLIESRLKNDGLVPEEHRMLTAIRARQKVSQEQTQTRFP